VLVSFIGFFIALNACIFNDNLKFPQILMAANWRSYSELSS